MMTPSERAARSAITNLIHLLTREKAAITMRAFERIRQFAAEKRKLFAALESADLTGLSPPSAASLTRALGELHRKASENAATLAALRQGMSDARQRLEALAVEQRKSGFYTARGVEISQEGAGAVARSA
jgi:hypothetical protein